LRRRLLQGIARRLFSVTTFTIPGSYPMKELLKDVRNGTLSIDSAIKIVTMVQEAEADTPQNLSATVENFATLDVSRAARVGFPEVVYGGGKSAKQVAAIFKVMRATEAHAAVPVVATKISPEKANEIKSLLDFDVRYEDSCELLSAMPSKVEVQKISGRVVVMSAGTSDMHISEEAAVLLELSGVKTVTRIYDVGAHNILTRMASLSSSALK